MLFWRKAPPVSPASPIYGVNLGGWLLLEKWMTPSIFTGGAIDEYTLCDGADDQTLAAIQKHRDTFITAEDFVWLKNQGIAAVRLPVNYGVFGGEPPYLETIEYVDKAFKWAEETGIKILLDLHGAPGSQNGWQESGQVGKVRWHKDEKNIIKTLQVIEGLVKRYGMHANLLGFEMLNEPHSKIRTRILQRYYEAAYKLIRLECGTKVWVVFSDNFKPRRWKRKLRAPKFENTIIDTHRYQAYTRKDKRLDLAGHMRKTLIGERRFLAKMAKRHPVIVGEWSLALNKKALEGFNPSQKAAARRAYGAAQLITYEHTAGWFYWSYKTEEGGVWSFRSCIDNGWLPPLDKPAKK